MAMAPASTTIPTMLAAACTTSLTVVGSKGGSGHWLLHRTAPDVAAVAPAAPSNTATSREERRKARPSSPTPRARRIRPQRYAAANGISAVPASLTYPRSHGPGTATNATSIVSAPTRIAIPAAAPVILVVLSPGLSETGATGLASAPSGLPDRGLWPKAAGGSGRGLGSEVVAGSGRGLGSEVVAGRGRWLRPGVAVQSRRRLRPEGAMGGGEGCRVGPERVGSRRAGMALCRLGSSGPGSGPGSGCGCGGGSGAGDAAGASCVWSATAVRHAPSREVWSGRAGWGRIELVVRAVTMPPDVIYVIEVERPSREDRSVCRWTGPVPARSVAAGVRWQVARRVGVWAGVAGQAGGDRPDEAVGSPDEFVAWGGLPRALHHAVHASAARVIECAGGSDDGRDGRQLGNRAGGGCRDGPGRRRGRAARA